MCGVCGCNENNVFELSSSPSAVLNHSHAHEHSKTIQIEQDILAKNNEFASINRKYFEDRQITALNIMSSPGSGKTTLLVKTILALKQTLSFSVIVGDQQTDRDTQRIATTGISALQINTGKGCHLDAHDIGHALEKLRPPSNSILFIENVGNLVCPALFDLGETYKVVILSVTEGEDKPLKYPHMFYSADLVLLAKMDLLPYVNFNVDECIQYIKQINHRATILQVSAMTENSLKNWQDWLCAH